MCDIPISMPSIHQCGFTTAMCELEAIASLTVWLVTCAGAGGHGSAGGNHGTSGTGTGTEGEHKSMMQKVKDALPGGKK